jgi:hypothetical protein
VSPRQWLIAGVAAAAILVGLALALDLGPFGDDEELVEAEFLAQGDEICRAAHEEFESLQGDTPNTPGEAADLTGDLIDISEGEVDEIRDLDAPPALQQPLQRYFDAREEGIAQLQKGLEAAEDRDAFAYADAQAKVAAGQVRRLQLAKEVGFEECSRVLFGRDQLAADSEPPVSSSANAPPTGEKPADGNALASHAERASLAPLVWTNARSLGWGRGEK